MDDVIFSLAAGGDVGGDVLASVGMP